MENADGLASQESRCREYARHKGYEVLEVFNDNKSGGDANRPAMIALLAYLKAQKETCVVIIDDINRFARDALERVAGHCNMLVRDEPLASIIQEALEGFACGHFETQAKVKRFRTSKPAFPKFFADGTTRFERIIHQITRTYFAGHIEIPEWDVSLRKGHNEGLTSLETHDLIQQQIKDGARAPARKDASADLSLQGFVCCDD